MIDYNSVVRLCSRFVTNHKSYLMFDLMKYIAFNLLLIPGHNRGVAALASNASNATPLVFPAEALLWCTLEFEDAFLQSGAFFRSHFAS
jgi:hypothetical protein